MRFRYIRDKYECPFDFAYLSNREESTFILPGTILIYGAWRLWRYPCAVDAPSENLLRLLTYGCDSGVRRLVDHAGLRHFLPDQ